MAPSDSFDPADVWATRRRTPRVPFTAHEPLLPEEELSTSAAELRWARFLGQSELERKETANWLVGNWPYEWQRRVMCYSCHIASCAALATSYLIAKRMSVNLKLDGMHMTRLITLTTCYGGILSVVTNETVVKQKLLDPGKSVSAARLYSTQCAVSLLSGVLLPAITAPWLAHFEYVTAYGSKPRIGPRLVRASAGFWGFFAVMWYLSWPVLRERGAHCVALNVAAGAATAASQRWAAQRILATARSDPSMLDLYGGTGTGSVGFNIFASASDTVTRLYYSTKDWLFGDSYAKGGRK